ncbi:DUF1648 domain-containing protein [Brachybacterium saurashtrense]|uniref:DUF1648 domain-containing protein n=1 Tax=Brachybacterium saurashtrense TaxID=556288 RepID=A0A345YJZ6_9MICO|nr:DUF1648 domain-containing protein [Brachybacterium saurashtrense]AXK44248.1 DUF1648 domain-containing protein [Brachybacterium saurashtrense]RRR21520.1 DUF1648 domain-containing protein [Brachybacterium saurashtrense]
MNSSTTAPARPSRTYATGPLTRVLRGASVLSALAITAWILRSYPDLPATVATHFDARGQADAWGPRWSVLVLAALMVLLSVGMAALSTRPRWFNYPREVTERTAQAVYREGERLMVWTVLAMQLIYLGIAWSVILGVGMALIALGVAGLLGAVSVGIVRVARAGS